MVLSPFHDLVRFPVMIFVMPNSLAAPICVDPGIEESY